MPLDDILDGAFGAHSAQRGVNALARGGERCAEALLAAQQAVRQAAFALQLVHQRLDPQAEADLGTGRPRVAEGLGAAVHGQTGHRQQQADRDRDDHRHTASDAAPARHRPTAARRRPVTGSRSVTGRGRRNWPAARSRPCRNCSCRLRRACRAAAEMASTPSCHEVSPTAVAAGFRPVRARGNFSCAALTPQAGDCDRAGRTRSRRWSSRDGRLKSFATVVRERGVRRGARIDDLPGGAAYRTSLFRRPVRPRKH